MEKVRFKIPQQQWRSTVTKYSPHRPEVSPDSLTAGSSNFDTDTIGAIVKRLGDVSFTDGSSPSGTIRDTYEGVFADGAHHLLRVREGILEYSSGTPTFNEVATGYQATENFEFEMFLDRVYFGNGVDDNQVYDRTENYGGVAYSPPEVKVMGAQAPADALSGAEGAAGSLAAGTYNYKVTFLYYDFEESNGGPASGDITIGANKKIDITDIPIGDYGVTARKLYRSDDGGLSYFLVATIAENTSDTYTDDNDAPGAAIPIDHTEPVKFKYIRQYRDRLWITPADEPSALDYSSAGLPDIFPATNRLFCNPRDIITGITIFNDRVMVFAQRSFGYISGTAPDSFRYVEVSNQVGCADVRSIQTITIQGVPQLVWLGDKHVYMFNGSTVNDVSDAIADKLGTSIQQATRVRGFNTQTSQTQFEDGYFVATGAIDTTTSPGLLTLINPKNVVSAQAAWEGGASTEGIVTRRPSAPDSLSQGAKNTFLRTTGDYSDTILTSGNLTLETVADFTGESGAPSTSRSLTVGAVSALAYPFIITSAGAITNITISVLMSATVAFDYQIKVWTSVGGSPDTELYASSILTSSTPVFGSVSIDASQALSTALPTGTYWFGLERTSTSGGLILAQPNTPFSGGQPKIKNSGTWIAPPYSINFGAVTSPSYTFSQTAVPGAGSWTSPIYDSGLFPQAAAMDVAVAHTATMPSGTSLETFVDQSSSSDMLNDLETHSAVNLNGSSTKTFSVTDRYWQVRIQLATTDNRAVPAVTSDPSITFDTPVTWISASIDNTTDISDMDELLVTIGSLPTNTSVTAIVQKCATEFGSFTDDFTSAPLVAGLNTLDISGMTNATQRYSRIKLVLDNSASTKDVTPVVDSAQLNWALATTFFSQVIDTGAAPGGFDIFSAQDTLNGGTLTYSVRASDTEADLNDDVPAGPYIPAFTEVADGAFPTSDPGQFLQWEVDFTATADHVPTIDSVTTRWLISGGAQIRVASLFYNQRYYLAVADSGSLTNNLVLVMDRAGLWRIYEGQLVGTFTYFFGEPYFSDSATPIIRRLGSGTDDHGNAITLTVVTKAFDFDNIQARKLLRGVWATVGNTGGTWSFFYSTDSGATFLPLYDFDGNASSTVSADGGLTDLRLTPAGDLIVSGKTLMVKAVEATDNDAILHELQISAFLRQGELLNS